MERYKERFILYYMLLCVWVAMSISCHEYQMAGLWAGMPVSYSIYDLMFLYVIVSLFNEGMLSLSVYVSINIISYGMSF